MASIERRGPSWRVRWRDGAGRSRSKHCPDLSIAYHLKEEIENAAMQGGEWSCPYHRSIPDLPEIFAAYADDCTRFLRPGTAERYARALDLFLRFLEGRQETGARLYPILLTRQSLADWYESLGTSGRHGRSRVASTKRKLVEIVPLAWRWAYNDDVYGDFTPRPRRLRMPIEAAKPAVAPTWEEMDACIREANGWQKRLAIVLRFTGLRVQQVMALQWNDLDIRRGKLRIRGELGKSKQERRGRIIPISRYLIADLKRWKRTERWIVPCNRKSGGPRARVARARDMGRAWRRAGVRPEAWTQPHHSFRKGFVNGLKRLGADSEAVKHLVGHSLGLRGVYVDPDSLPLDEAVKLIPPLRMDT